MKKTTKTMSNLSLDIELVNPIESKSLFGGCDYCGNDYHNISGGGDWGTSVALGGLTITGNGNWWINQPPPGAAYNSIGNWNSNYYGDNNGGGSASGDGNGDGNYSWWVDANGDGINDYEQNSENFVNHDSFLNYAQGDADGYEISDIESKVRSAAGVVGLGSGFTGTAIDGLNALIQELGFTPSKVVGFGQALGIASVVIGGSEIYFQARDAANGVDPWTDADTLNAASTVFGAAALIPSPFSLVFGGISIGIGLVGGCNDYASKRTI